MKCNVYEKFVSDMLYLNFFLKKKLELFFPNENDI